VRTPDGQGRLELTKFHNPTATMPDPVRVQLKRAAGDAELRELVRYRSKLVAARSSFKAQAFARTWRPKAATTTAPYVPSFTASV
jgi:hypothetical protein